MTRFRALAFLCLTLVAGLVIAKDIAGGKDHPLVSRFTGSQLDGFQEIEFGQGVFYLPDPAASAKELVQDKPLSIEGKVTRLLYIAPKGKSPLEVHRNFEQALKSAGVAIKTAVDGKGASWEPSQHWRTNFQTMKFQGRWAADVSPFWRDGMYVYGVINRSGSQWHVSVLTAQNFSETSAPQAAVAVQIVEPVAMATGQVKVNADALKQGLSADGKIALYGIFFDTGKADLKTESKAQLDEMVKLLQQNAALRVFIVGHTDNQGAFDSNITLSQQRAQAVVNALVKDYKVDAKRLGARGAANIAPVASNTSEAGRAKNRRVELVEQ
jgi:OmpA-OmpF porin, OOP family